MECLAALMEAVKHAEQAARSLATAPDADLVTKNAIATEVDQLSRQLEVITRRLEEMPTWKPKTTSCGTSGSRPCAER